MKKTVFILLLCLVFCFPLHVLAEEAETPPDQSQPRLMVTDFALAGGFLTAGESAKLTVTVKNQSMTKSVRNVKYAISEPSGALAFEGMGTRYVSAVSAGCTDVWELTLSALPAAAPGAYDLTVSMEYEDKYYASFSAADTLRVYVKQPASLDFDGAVLPLRAVQSDTVTMSLNLMNTGKGTLYNCRVDTNIKGLMSGGSVFAGEIPPGESRPCAANLLVSKDVTGDVTGTVTVTYEDADGVVYTKTADVFTSIEEKVDEAAPQTTTEEKKTLPWWLTGGAGLLLGGGAAFGVTYGVFAAKQRKQDELRL